jgi:hypothetical protein
MLDSTVTTHIQIRSALNLTSDLEMIFGSVPHPIFCTGLARVLTDQRKCEKLDPGTVWTVIFFDMVPVSIFCY